MLFCSAAAAAWFLCLASLFLLRLVCVLLLLLLLLVVLLVCVCVCVVAFVALLVCVSFVDCDVTPVVSIRCLFHVIKAMSQSEETQFLFRVPPSPPGVCFLGVASRDLHAHDL